LSFRELLFVFQYSHSSVLFLFPYHEAPSLFLRYHCTVAEQVENVRVTLVY
jgi:hypothetical protein